MPIDYAYLLAQPCRATVPGYTDVRDDPVAVTVPPFAGAVRYRGEHIHCPTAAMRVTQAITPGTVHMPEDNVGGVYDPNGDMYFLPYDDDHIWSMRLPSPPPGGVTQFITVNLSGCRFFIDQIAGSTDYMVYHANTHQHGVTPRDDADVQSAAASAVLDQMLADARNDLAPLNFVTAASCLKTTYYRPAGNAERGLRFLGKVNVDRTAQRPRNEPSFNGGCTVAGFVAGGAWQFWWQCWGQVDHRDPDTVEHRRLRRDLVTPGTAHHPAQAVLGVGRIL